MHAKLFVLIVEIGILLGGLIDMYIQGKKGSPEEERKLGQNHKH